MNPKKLDLSGEVYGRLTVLSMAERGKHGQARCLCRCVCGVEKTTDAGPLRRGVVVSCGCLRNERARVNVVKATAAAVFSVGNLKHGLSETPEWYAWTALRARCGSGNNRAFASYGGRGVTVCDRWRESFENFLTDMGPRPVGCSLDRIDNDGPYSPENCRWADRTAQARNRRSNHVIEFNGRSQSLAAWAEEVGIRQETIRGRLKRGWSVEHALTAP